MSEFDEQSQEPDSDIFHFAINGDAFPDDFSMEDVAFACELDALFAVEEENLPPLFVQTLMASDDSRLQPVEKGLEEKTRANVFRRLKLKRRLFCTARPPLRTSLAEGLKSFSRPLLVLGTSFLLFMTIMVVVTGPTFADGLNYLWAGAHSGVLQVSSFPVLSHANTPVATRTSVSRDASDKLSLYNAAVRLRFPLLLPLAIPERYSQRNLYLYDGDALWANGPIMVLDYTYALPGVAPRHITICEFKPQGDIFQVVQNGAAHRIIIGEQGGSSDSAIYVEGHWTQASDSSYTWDYSDQSELVMESNGVALWIVGDKRDGINQDTLSSIARSLTVYRPAAHPGSELEVTQGGDSTPSIFANDVIYLSNPDNPDGPSFKLIGTPSNNHLH
jgi:hypothetical protein